MDDVDSEAAPAQHGFDHELIDRVVLGDEDDARAPATAAASSAVAGSSVLDVPEHVRERLEQRGAADRLGQRPRSTSAPAPLVPAEVSITSRLAFSSGSERIARATSAPLISGISESSSTRS